MAGTIFNLVISLLVSLVFILLGIRQYRADQPVSISTGETPPRAEALTSVAEWNHRHGRNLVIFGCALFLTLSVFPFAIEKTDSAALPVVILVLVLSAEVAWVVLAHRAMKKSMLKSASV